MSPGYSAGEVSELTANDIRSIKMTSDGLRIGGDDGIEWWYEPFTCTVDTEISINGMKITHGPTEGLNPNLMIARVDEFEASLIDPGPNERNKVSVKIHGEGTFSQE